MFRIVPFGDFHIFFRPNSSTRCFVWGDRGALHADAMLQELHCAESIVTWSSVCIAVLHTKVVVLKIDIEVRHDEAVLDELPDDAGHFIAIEFDDRMFNLDLCHGNTSFFVSALCRISLVSVLVHNSVSRLGLPPYHLSLMDFEWSPEHIAACARRPAEVAKQMP